MEINIKITSAEDVEQAKKVFAALTGEAEQVAVEAPKPAKAKTTAKPKKADKPTVTMEQVQERVDELDAKGLDKEIVIMFRDHFKGRLSELKMSQYPEVLERLALIEKIAEDDAAFEEIEAPSTEEKTVTKAELEAKFKELLDDHRAKLKALLTKFEVQKLSNLEASQYVAFYEELEAI